MQSWPVWITVLICCILKNSTRNPNKILQDRNTNRVVKCQLRVNHLDFWDVVSVDNQALKLNEWWMFSKEACKWRPPCVVWVGVWRQTSTLLLQGRDQQRRPQYDLAFDDSDDKTHLYAFVCFSSAARPLGLIRSVSVSSFWFLTKKHISRSQWPSGLKRGSKTDALTGVAGSNPRRGHGCLCCVYCTERTNAKSQDKERGILLKRKQRAPLGAWMSVSCECNCCQVEVSATGRSFV